MSVLSTDADREREEEASLLERLRAGDERSFEQLVMLHGGAMLAVIRRMLGHDADSQDCLQDAFTSAFKALGSFQGESRLGTWLHRIAVNAALMKIRSRKRRPERPIEDLLPRYQADGHRETPVPQWAVAQDVTAIDEDTRQVVRHCIAELPETFRVVLMLRDIEECSTEETSRLLEISVANVKTRLHRARQALRELLDRHLGEP